MSLNCEPQPDLQRGCGGCAGGPCSANAPDNTLRLRGWRLVLASSGFFLGPIAFAIVGAALLNRNPNSQLLGAFIGLSVGLVLVGGLAKSFECSEEAG